MIVGYERPLTVARLRPSRDNCESCHWPSVVHRDSMAIKKRYDTDEKSSESILPPDAAHRHGHDPRGHRQGHPLAHRERSQLHRHRSAAAHDPVGAGQARADGKVSTYVDATSKLSEAELKKFEVRRMECYDCHNAVGHPFRNPEDLVDEAIATGGSTAACRTPRRARWR
jgi:hypothetical protein